MLGDNELINAKLKHTSTCTEKEPVYKVKFILDASRIEVTEISEKDKKEIMSWWGRKGLFPIRVLTIEASEKAISVDREMVSAIIIEQYRR